MIICKEAFFSDVNKIILNNSYYIIYIIFLHSIFFLKNYIILNYIILVNIGDIYLRITINLISLLIRACRIQIL